MMHGSAVHYRYARCIPDSTWPLTQSITVMQGVYQTVSDLWPRTLPLCTVHIRHYLTSDPVHYRYAPTYQTVSDLWPSPLPSCTVHTREYLTSDPGHCRYARCKPDSNWPLTQFITVMHGTYQTVSDFWPSPLPLCTVHTRQYLTSDPPRYRYARYIPDSTWPLTHPVTVMHGTYQTVPDLW